MSLIKTCDVHKTVYYKQCRECLHEINKAGKQMDREMDKRKKLIAKQKLQQSQPKPAVKKVSDKRKEQNHEYFKLVEQFKKDNPQCHAKILVGMVSICTINTEDPHHRKGRGKYLLDVSTWLPVCRNCHIYIENHPEEAKEKGWSESRLAIDQSKQTI